MSHNTHYVLVNAEDVETAQYRVESELDGFGNENNWYSIVKVVNVTNESEQDYLQQKIDYLNKEVSVEHYEDLLSKAKECFNNASVDSRYNFAWASEYLQKVYEIAPFTKREPVTIDNLKEGTAEDYNGYNYDRYGWTNLVHEPLEEDDIYFVEIDVHS